MKRFFLILTVVLLCFSLCSCDTILKKAKSFVTGEEESEMPNDYIATMENEQFSYEVYDSYVKLIKYIAKDAESTIVDLPDQLEGRPVTVIGALCFFETESSVTQVNISSSITTIEENAFYYVDGITSVNIPDNVTKIGSRAFAWCNNLETVVIGSGIKQIPEFCFNHCTALKNVSFSSELKKINTRAFSYCGGMTEFVIPASIEEVGDRAFDSCINLEHVYFEGMNAVIAGDVLANCEKAVIIAADGSTAKAYCEENGLRWSTSKDIEAIIPGESSQVESSAA